MLPIDVLVAEQYADLNAIRWGYTATATASGTLTLTALSTFVQLFTGGSTGQVVKLPDATTLAKTGFAWHVWNDAVVPVTLQDNAGTQLALIQPNQRCLVLCTDKSSAAGAWSMVITEKTPQTSEQFVVVMPASGFVVNYTAGTARFNGVMTAVGAGSLTLPASTTGLIYLDVDATVKQMAGNTPPPDAEALYTFTTNSSGITALADVRENIDHDTEWGVVGDVTTLRAHQAKAAGSLNKPARADHSHDFPVLLTKSGVIAFNDAGWAQHANGNYFYAVTFSTAYPSGNYTPRASGVDNRAWSYSGRTLTGFTIETNSKTALTGEVAWTAVETGESL